MADEPSFPKPSSTRTAAAPVYRAPAVREPEAAPLVVTRADAPADEPTFGKAKLTREEIRAMVAVNGTQEKTAGFILWKRGRVAAVVSTVVSLLAHWILGSGWLGYGVDVAMFVGGLYWTAKPLLFKKGWD